MKHRYWIYSGIAGALLMGAGDWLLGLTEPSPVNGVLWDVLVMGYTTGYSMYRPTAAMLLGFFGVLFYAPCMWGMCGVFKNEKTRRRERIFMMTSMLGWALLHYIYSAAVFNFAYLYNAAGHEAAVNASNALYKAVLPGMVPWLTLMLLPFLLHFYDTAAGNSILPKRLLLFHPLIWWALFYFGTYIPAQTAFTNGLRTFAMNGSMLIWLIAVWIYSIIHDLRF